MTWHLWVLFWFTLLKLFQCHTLLRVIVVVYSQNGWNVYKAVCRFIRQEGDADSHGRLGCCRKDDNPLQAEAGRDCHHNSHDRSVVICMWGCWIIWIHGLFREGFPTCLCLYCTTVNKPYVEHFIHRMMVVYCHDMLWLKWIVISMC